MGLHHSLHDLVSSLGGGVTADAEEFRGVLDDFLSEDDATVGELNLLVDAVRLGAVSRLVAIVEAGADVAAAVREAGTALARDRGSDDAARSQWAVAVLGFALGFVPESVVARYPRASSVPLPPPTTAPPAPGAQLPPTRLPHAPAVMHPPTAVAAARGGTFPTVPPGPVTSPAGGRSTLLVLALAVVLLLVAGGGVTYAVIRSDDEGPGTSAGPLPGPADAPATSARPGTVIDAPDVAPAEARGTHAMASSSGGVLLSAFGPVDSVGSGEDEVIAPDGGRLLAFRLGNWKGCESTPCRSWTRLDLRVEVAGRTSRLPGGGPTFVVALPSGEDSADLVYRDPADGYRQSLSLSTGEPTGDNITVLARPRRERVVRIPSGVGSFRVVDVVTPNLSGLTDAELARDVRVRSAELFFTDDRRPLSRPDRAYLRVHVDFNSPVDPTRYRFREELLTFTDTEGVEYDAIDLDRGESEHDRDPVFEVPGSTRGGTITIGGTYSTEAVNVDGVGTPIRITVPERSVRFAFPS